MKKHAILLTALSLCLMTGCSGAKANISNGSQTLFTVGNTKVTAQDEYDLIKQANGGSFTFELAKRALYDEIVPVTDEMKEEAEKTYEELTGYYDDLESQLQMMGYEGKDEYIKSVLLPEQQNVALQKQYFLDNKTAIRKEYKPSIAKILQCETEESAKEALEEIKKGTDLDAVYEKYSVKDSAFKNEEVVMITSNSSVPTAVVNALYKAEEKGVIDEVFPAVDATTYAYVAILVTHGYDKNVDKFQEEITSASSTITNETLEFYFKKVGFKIYDQDVFDYFKVNNPSFLFDHPELNVKE